MASVVITGDTSGAITLAAPAVAGTNTITLPANTGTVVVGSSAVSAAGQIPFSTDGTTYTPTAKIVYGSNTATTSGTNVTFTGIPSWVKRITMMLNGVTVNGGTVPAILIQIGSGSLTTSGYASTGNTLVSGVSQTSSTSGFVYRGSGGASTYNGIITVQNITGNTWVCTPIGSNTAASQIFTGSGFVTLGGVLDRIALVTTDALNGGSVNISYE